VIASRGGSEARCAGSHILKGQLAEVRKVKARERGGGDADGA